jgi:hypothetical protein
MTAPSARAVAIAAVACLLVACSGHAVPSATQLGWQGQFGSIICWNMATFAGSQGCQRSNWANASDPLTFGVGLDGHVDTDSWGRAMQAANITCALRARTLVPGVRRSLSPLGGRRCVHCTHT